MSLTTIIRSFAVLLIAYNTKVVASAADACHAGPCLEGAAAELETASLAAESAWVGLQMSGVSREAESASAPCPAGEPGCPGAVGAQAASVGAASGWAQASESAAVNLQMRAPRAKAQSDFVGEPMRKPKKAGASFVGGPAKKPKAKAKASKKNALEDMSKDDLIKKIQMMEASAAEGKTNDKDSTETQQSWASRAFGHFR